MADKTVDEDDIWNYKTTASRRDNSAKRRGSKRGSDEGLEGNGKKKAQPSTEEHDGFVIDVDLEEDVPFVNTRRVSNQQSTKQWAAMFSKKGENNNDKINSENQKRKNKNGVKQSKKKKAILKTTKKQESGDSSLTSSTKKNYKEDSLINTQYFSPCKKSPKGGRKVPDCDQDGLKVTEESFGLNNNSGDIMKEEENSPQNLIDVDGEYVQGEPVPIPIETDFKAEPKVVDVIVLEDDRDDVYWAANETFNIEEQISASDACAFDQESEGGFVKEDIESTNGFVLKEVKDLHGGFIKEDVDSDNDEIHLELESKSSRETETQKSFTNILKAGFGELKLKVESTIRSTSSFFSNNGPGGKCEVSDLKSSSADEPALTVTVARKQTSLYSFFNSKSSPSNSKVNSSEIACPPLKKISTVPTSNKGGWWQRGWSKPSNSNSEKLPVAEKDETKPTRGRQRQCPFYKKIPGTGITVDAFRYGAIPGCTAYFLTHFHYDHYGGLTKKFAQPIYCSEVTANLVERRLGVDPRYINRLPLWKPVEVEGVTLTLMEANHCPGAVIVVFETDQGRKILHTGDFRASLEMEEYPPLKNIVVDELFLDTTYCNPSYAFPSQKTVIDFTISLVQKQMIANPKTLIVCGAYTIGKERIFSAIANILDSKICVMSDKKKVLDCLDDDDLKKRLTLNWSEGQVHVLPMAKLRQEALFDHHSRHARFTSILALEPTGWTHNNKAISLDTLKPKWSRNGVTLYGVPYSEHSSYLELKRFVQFIRPKKILPTVNNGNPAAREKMENTFREWLSEKCPSEDGDSDVESPQQSTLKDWLTY